MGKSAKCHIFSPLLCVALVLVPCLVLNYFQGFCLFSFIVTIPLLLLSTTFLVIFSKKQQHTCIDEKVLQEENPTCDSSSNFIGNKPEEKLEQVLENVAPNEAAAQEGEVGYVHEAEEFPSDSESIDDDSVSSENFELDWIRCSSVGQKGAISSDSVSEDDEDSLIEIAIPGTSGHSTCNNNWSDGEPKQKMQSNNLPDDFLPESFMRQQGLLELFADVNEVNEEENLIEIDISMGSIKCSAY